MSAAHYPYSWHDQTTGSRVEDQLYPSGWQNQALDNAPKHNTERPRVSAPSLHSIVDCRVRRDHRLSFVIRLRIEKGLGPVCESVLSSRHLFFEPARRYNGKRFMYESESEFNCKLAWLCHACAYKYLLVRRTTISIDAIGPYSRSCHVKAIFRNESILPRCSWYHINVIHHYEWLIHCPGFISNKDFLIITLLMIRNERRNQGWRVDANKFVGFPMIIPFFPRPRHIVLVFLLVPS